MIFNPDIVFFSCRISIWIFFVAPIVFAATFLFLSSELVSIDCHFSCKFLLDLGVMSDF